MHKVYHVPRWLLLGNDGTAWMPNISLIANDMPEHQRLQVQDHELIHQMQQDELGYFIWVVKYLDFHFEHGYRANPFELDAWKWEKNIGNRPSRAWELYVE